MPYRALFDSGVLVLVLVSMPSVQSHGYLVDPAVVWPNGYPANGFTSTIDNEIWGMYDNAKYGYGVNGTLSFFTDVFPTKGYDSLGAFIVKNQELISAEVSAECGLNIYKDAARSELPASQLTYSGFTHPGPCEVWCDDTKVLVEDDCQSKFSAIPALMPYEETKCANANRMTLYWIALHGDPWQVYTNCAWLKGGSGSGGAPSQLGSNTSTTAENKGQKNSTPTKATTPAPTTVPTTSSSSNDFADEATYSSNESSTLESTPAPGPMSASPAITSSKCTRRN